jgi:hypothetical protein
VGKKVCFAMKGDSLQTGHDDDDANVIFRVKGIMDIHE